MRLAVDDLDGGAVRAEDAADDPRREFGFRSSHQLGAAGPRGRLAVQARRMHRQPIQFEPELVADQFQLDHVPVGHRVAVRRGTHVPAALTQALLYQP